MSEPTCECGHETRWHGDLGCGYLGWHYGAPKCGCRLTDSAVVEQIVARHVATALTEAADAIEASGAVCNTAHGNRCIGGIAYRDAARIVRAQIPPP